MDMVKDFAGIPPDLLADAFEALAEGIAIYDAEECLVACNDRYRELMGDTAHCVAPGYRWSDLIRQFAEIGMISETHGSSDAWIAEVRRARAADEQHEAICTLDGCWYQVTYHPTKSGGFVVTRENITKRRAAEAVAEDRLGLLRTVLDTIPTPVVMVRLSDARVVYCSPAAIETFGSPEYASAYYRDPEERRAYIDQVKTQGRVEDFLVKTQRADGRETIASISGGVTEYNGEPCVVSSVTDLTERLEHEALVRNFVEACPWPFMINRADSGEILYRSPESVALLGPAKSAIEFYVEPSDRKGLLDVLRRDGVAIEHRCRHYNAKGKKIWVAVSSRLLEWQGEDLMVSTARDLSPQLAVEAELNRQREQVFQAEKMSALGSLLAGVAHELNNPLSVVVGHAMMLGDEVEDDDVLRQVKKIANAAERCSKIVKTFLTMARQEPTKMEVVDLNEIVQTAVDVARYGKTPDVVQIHTALDPEPAKICADADQITQVIINLILNAEQAIYASGKGDSVKICTQRKKGQIHLSVTDNGPGISRDILPRIFEPFFTTKGVGEGTGIGLAMCHRVVTTHGGNIAVEKTGSDGTRFVVEVPVVQGNSLETAPEPEAPGLISCRVLVIDDEAAVAELNAEVLTRGGYEAEIAYRAEDALEMLRNGHFDVVISDLNMPGLDGRGVFDAIRREFPDMIERTGFITGDTLGQASQTFLAESNRPFLEKPVAPKDLREFVSQLSRREAS